MMQETNEMSAIDAMLSQEFGDIAHIVHLHAQERSDHAALIQGETRWSYGELDAVMDRVAAALRRDGIRPGEAIAIAAGTSIEYAAVSSAPCAPASRFHRWPPHRRPLRSPR
jgi:long-chain acyl-CoA synthetase